MSWEQLLATRREAVAEYLSERSKPPTACPYDGEPLQSRGDGRLHCPFDGWEWPRDPNPLHGGT